MKGSTKNEFNQELKLNGKSFDSYNNEFFQIQNLVSEGNDSIFGTPLKDESCNTTY
jgi:hypothetical protein